MQDWSNPDRALTQAKKLETKWDPFKLGYKIEAIELYNKAGIQYRLQNQDKLSGQCYEKSANLSERLGDFEDTIDSLIEAAKIYHSKYPSEALQCYYRAISHSLSHRSLSFIGRLYKIVGKIEERVFGRWSQAVSAYQEAEKYYRADNNSSEQNLMTCRLGILYGRQKLYLKAYETFELLAKNLTNQGFCSSSRKYWFKAGICRLALGPANNQFLGNYLTWCPELATSREYQLLDQCLQAQQKADPEHFSRAIKDYGYLNLWMMKILTEAQTLSDCSIQHEIDLM